MTDVSSVKAHADSQPAPLALYDGLPSTYADGSPPRDRTIEEDESSTIKCICGFSDDDGNTVLCEKCDTWQHIVCYYESAVHVPDVHECADCQPRAVDSKSASEKQRHRRESLLIGERKGRPKTTAKNPKKRTKDTAGAVQPNGWPVNTTDLHYSHDRKSGSPRDQPPPNKRPKTSHRSSGSMSVVSQAPALVPGSRKRGSSILVNGHSPVKSPTNPDGSMEEYSFEFMNLYTGEEPPSPESNSYASVGVANDISNWLADPDELASASGGKKPQEVFSRIDVPIQDLPTPDITKQSELDSSILAHGRHPQWQLLTVDTLVPEGGYIGELKGVVGLKKDYYEDPDNRWDVLRHPEPFVFFHPLLPAYVDTRKEGNILRYARRSCVPNMHMKIFIESSNDCHFCFLAARQIEPGEELTVGWDIDAEIHKQLAKVVTNATKEGFRKIQPWVSNVLANFGGCACDTANGHQCLLELARRNAPVEPVKKGRKSKKFQVSPLSTGHATNSRAGSETLNRDAADDEQMDARSTSGSHKSSSRDITPATHFSLDGDLKMSEREKRKLQQQERLFQQMDHDEEHKTKKGKRNSAGSTLNTPSLSSSRRIGHPEPSPSVRHREHSHGVARKVSGSSTKTNGRAAPKPKPVYKEASTQTEDDGAAGIHACLRTREMKPPISFKRRLLQQAQEDRLQRERMRSASVKMEAKSPALKDMTANKPSPLPPSPPLDELSTMDAVPTSAVDTKVREPTPAREPTPTPTVDAEMNDVDETTDQPIEPKTEEMPDATPADVPMEPPDSSLLLPAPSWSVSARSLDLPQKTAELSIEMPEKPDLSAGSTSLPLVTPGSSTTLLANSAIAQSPSNVTSASPFSPAVNNSVNPTPARKKLSLSDYTSRRAKLAQSHSAGTPPFSQSQAISSPTLSTASLPTNNSPPRHSAEPTLPPVTEDTKPAETDVTGTNPLSTAATSTSI